MGISCTSATTATTTTQYNNAIVGMTASQLGTECNCVGGTTVTCPSTGNTATTPTCSTRRQIVNGLAGVTCPSATTLSQAQACFKAAACQGLINSANTCQYSTLTQACPNCEGSKKGLLGLLGLL